MAGWTRAPGWPSSLYLVFNAGLNTERAAFKPALPLSAGRTLLLKYSHAVPFGW